MPNFEVIPVVDLMGGLVVHARAGERDRYRPLESPLAASSEPADVVRGLLALHPFRSLYIADLDAIQGRGDHVAAVRALKEVGFRGFIIDDHVPFLVNDSPWSHRGRAFATGYIKALVDVVNRRS